MRYQVIEKIYKIQDIANYFHKPIQEIYDLVKKHKIGLYIEKTRRFVKKDLDKISDVLSNS